MFSSFGWLSQKVNVYLTIIMFIKPSLKRMMYIYSFSIYIKIYISLFTVYSQNCIYNFRNDIVFSLQDKLYISLRLIFNQIFNYFLLTKLFWF